MSRSGYQTSQNCDNFLSDRPSTRLHAPPGGSSQLNFLFGGGDDAAPQQPQRGGRRRPPSQEQQQQQQQQFYQQQQKDYHHQQQQQQQQHDARREAPKREENPAQDVVFGGRSKVSSNAYANGSNQNAGNVLTDRPTTRLHAPPGGKSSITFG